VCTQCLSAGTGVRQQVGGTMCPQCSNWSKSSCVSVSVEIKLDKPVSRRSGLGARGSVGLSGPPLAMRVSMSLYG